MTAVNFMSNLSTAGRAMNVAPAVESNQPKTMMVDCWEDGKWVSRKVIWTGEKYEYAN